MKGHALFATCSFISARTLFAFVAPSLLQLQQPLQSTSRASSHHSRNGRTHLTSQLIVTVNAPRPALPPGKRMIRRRKAPPSPAPVSDVEIRNAPVEVIRSESEYIAILKENEQSLVVIKFFATWCRSCKSMDLKYRRLALEHENVKFYEVDVLESPELKKAMAVKAVPTVKLHAGSLGEVASFPCGPKKVTVYGTVVVRAPCSPLSSHYCLI
ncbi:unnamed protein product [Ascophyllum nodosum]